MPKGETYANLSCWSYWSWSNRQLHLTMKLPRVVHSFCLIATDQLTMLPRTSGWLPEQTHIRSKPTFSLNAGGLTVATSITITGKCWKRSSWISLASVRQLKFAPTLYKMPLGPESRRSGQKSRWPSAWSKRTPWLTSVGKMMWYWQLIALVAEIHFSPKHGG